MCLGGAGDGQGTAVPTERGGGGGGGGTQRLHGAGCLVRLSARYA